MIKPVDGGITAGFSQPRPYGSPNPTHIHGAVDIAGQYGTPVRAPEAGRYYYQILTRQKDDKTWWKDQTGDWLGYWYEYYGTIIVLHAAKRTHIIAHIEPADRTTEWVDIFIDGDERYPKIMHVTDVGICSKGDLLGQIAVGGLSTGPHIHWEIHPDNKWHKHVDRLNPEDLYMVNGILV